MTNNFFRFVFLYFFLILFSSVKAGVKISEVMPCNVATYMNSDYNYVPWLEFYNDGEDAVNLQGYTIIHLKKGGSEKGRCEIKSKCEIDGDDYLLFYFDEENKDRHAAFKLDPDGGSVILQKDSKEICKITYPAMQPHLSYGVDDDGVTGYMEPSPGKDNKVAYPSLSSRCAQPTFSTTPGIQLSDKITLAISTATEDAEIYYTTNGSIPDKNSKLYSEPLTIEKGKNRVIRAKAFKKNMLSSAVKTGSYIFPDSRHTECGGFTAPIVSIVVDSTDFFSGSKGIYVKGTNGKVNSSKSCIGEAANYNQDWSRPLNFEYIVDGNLVLSQECEASVMGGCSRQYDKKSLKINANKRSGSNRFKYDFFPEKKGNEYKSIQLRNGGNAYEGLRPRDGFMQSIAGTMDIDCQAYMPVAYYINGKYSGLMGLRERANKDYIFSNYGIDEEDLDVIEISGEPTASTGTLDAYNALVEAVQEDPTSDTYYSKISKLIDVEEYIDFHIFEQFIVNTDWPGNNHKLWRERNNGRFRWIIYDTDFGLGLYDAGAPNYTGVEMNMLKFAMGEGITNWANRDVWQIVLFKNLMKNEEFSKRFLTKYLYRLENELSKSKIDSVWSVIEKRAGGEYCAWKEGASLENDGHGVLSFAHGRPDYIYNHLKSFYGGGDKIDVKVAVKDADGKAIPDATLLFNYEPVGNNYSTKYFSTLSLRVQPKVPLGYKFVKWETSKEISKTVNTVPLASSSTKWKYYFEEAAPEGDWTSLAFNDSEWKSGVCPIGKESRNITDKTELKGDFNTSYYRCVFNIEDVEFVDSLIAKVIYDDGMVVYVNGVEVKRLNMPKGEIDFATLAPTYTNDAEDVFYISRDYLVNGDNVIAVEVHQTEDSADMTFSLELLGIIGNSISKGEVLECSLTSSTDITAIYEIDDKFVAPVLQINEICSSNNSESGNEDEYGHYPDWIEIHNAGKTAVDMAGMYLSNDYNKMRMYRIPFDYPDETVIQPGEYKVFWADEATWRGPRHANFKISAKGAPLALSYYCKGKLVTADSITCVQLVANNSYGRAEDGEHWVKYGRCDDELITSTLGETNLGECKGETGYEGEYADYYGEGENENALLLYPNPAKQQLNLEVANGDAIKSIQIYNSLGAIVMDIAIVDKSSVDVSPLNGGTYFVRVVTEGAVYSNRFIKE